MRPRMIFVLLIGAISSASGESYSISITTEPSQGPFRIRQMVDFSCVIKPTPPDPVTYQWRNVEAYNYGSGRYSQNFSTYYNRDSLHFCWYYCEVSANQTLVGSANKLIEIHGFIHTDDSVFRSFNRGETLQLNVNISTDYYAQFIASLAWYHNGTRIISGNKFTVTDNDTTLSISNMIESDAGIYEVKINSVAYNSRSSPRCDFPRCDLAILPLLEYTVAHAPVVFTVQEHSLPEFNPDSVISTLCVTENSSDYTIIQKVQLRLIESVHLYLPSYWLRNGSNIYDGNMYNSSFTIQGEILTSYSLQIMYNNTDDIIGNYVGILRLDFFDYLNRIQCREDYSHYIYGIAPQYFEYVDNYFKIHVSYWSIKLSSDIQCNARGVYNDSSVPSSCSSQLVVVGVVCSLCFFTGGVLVGVLVTILLYKCYKKGLYRVQSLAAAAPPPPVYEDIDINHEDRAQPQGRDKTFELQENIAYGHAQK